MTIDELIEQAQTAKDRRNAEALLRWRDQLSVQATMRVHDTDAVYVRPYVVRAFWRRRPKLRQRLQSKRRAAL